MGGKNYFIIMALVLAVVGRILLQPIPSVEPVIPFAVLAGLVMGAEAGLIVGIAGYALSNIFMLGGLGIWTVFQGIGGALSGGIAGYSGKKKIITAEAVVGYSLLGTVLFELIMNIGWGALLVYPFSYVHIGSNLVIAYLVFLLFKNHEEGIEVK